MPRYFFNTVDGHRDHDDTGTELPDAAAARVVAIRYAGEIMNDQPETLCHGRDFRVDVTARDGTPLFAVIARAEAAPDPSGSS